MSKKKKQIIAIINGTSGMEKAESKYRNKNGIEMIPFAKGTSFIELAEIVLPDGDGAYSNPLYVCSSTHSSAIGTRRLGSLALEFLNTLRKNTPMDILSVSVGIGDGKLSLVYLVRVYNKNQPAFNGLFDFLQANEQRHASAITSSDILSVATERAYTDEEIAAHEKKWNKQAEFYNQSTAEKPFLNSIRKYTRRDIETEADKEELIYRLQFKDKQIPIILDYHTFISIFREAMSYLTSVEKDKYFSVLRGTTSKDAFMDVAEAYVTRTFIVKRKVLPQEDLQQLMARIHKALFELYIIKDLIDDPEITDIKITDPYSIRVRIKGKAYLSDITFIDDADYVRFIDGIAVSNGVDLSVPTQTFTDDHNDDYILRFSITAPYITSQNYPIIHIRKVSRKKMMAKDLIKAGMFDAKIRDYLLDCGKYSKGVVFAGPPGSGKTTCLNWFLEEAYESSAEILVIQENDELYSYRKGIMFEHVVTNPQRGEKPCSLEDLGQLALVAGANVFVIGEAKGGEICSAITLSNSGCRTAITIHSQSSTETIDKMADLAMRGYAKNYAEAKRMMKSFQTIVYLEEFQVKEISEVIGFDEEKKDVIYRPIYRREKK